MNSNTDQMVVDNIVSARDIFEPYVQDNKIRVTDVDPDNGLELLCYEDCDDDSDEVIKSCRGIVFNGNDILMKVFPYTSEIRADDSQILNKLDSMRNITHVTDSFEGALIRVFYYEGKWYTTTHRKLDAFRSKWGCQKSFGQIFVESLHNEMAHNEPFKKSIEDAIGEDVLSRFYHTLNCSKQYMFLVRNIRENRIVCDELSYDKVFHVGTFTNGIIDNETTLLIPRPRHHTFTNNEQLLNYVKNVNIRYQQGVIVYTSDNKQYKIVNTEYSNLFNIRGNEPSIKFRYLQLRGDPIRVSMLQRLYPEYYPDFEYYERILYERACFIYEKYVDRFINKQIAVTSPEEYQIVKACHGWHISDRRTNKVNLDVVIHFMNQQPPTLLNKIIRNVKENLMKHQ